MDLLEALEDRIVRKIAGKDATFVFLSARDRADLLREDLKQRKAAHKERRDEVLANLTAAGITGEQMFAELETHADNAPSTVTEQDWITFVNDPLNEQAIYSLSLKEVHGDKAEELASKARLTLGDKAKLCGLVVMTEPAAPEGQPDPNLNPPPAYGTTGTTSTGSTPAV
jgi:hypothetical protein